MLPTMKNIHPTWVWRLLLAASLIAVFSWTEAQASDCGCGPAQVAVSHAANCGAQESWLFARSRYTHDPATGIRVAQYQQRLPVEPLPDQRLVSSGYRRTRSVLRGADGATDTTYQVQSYGNGRGGMDAQWERFHDAWRGSTVGGGNFYAGGGFGFPGYGWGHPGNGQPGFGHPGFPDGRRGRWVPPGYGYGPGHGRPDAGRLDPDAADGYRDQRPRTPDRRFFNPGLPPVVDLNDKKPAPAPAP